MPRVRTLLLLVTCFTAACAAPGRLNVALSADQLDRELAKSFPVTRSASVVFLELADPKVKLVRGSNDLGLSLRASVGVAVLRLEGVLTVKGTLRYQPDDGQFFLDAPAVSSFEVPGLPAAELPEVLSFVNDVVRTVLPTVPLHRLERGGARWLLKAVKVEDGRVIAELGA